MMLRKILTSICIFHILFLCACSADFSTSISFVQLGENGLYYDVHTSNESQLWYFDASTGKTQMILNECSPLLDDAGKSTVLCQTDEVIVYDEEEKEVYLLQEEGLNSLVKLDMGAIALCDGNIKSIPYILEITEDFIYWGVREIDTDSDTGMFLGIYKQNLRDQETFVVSERKYDSYFDIVGIADDMIYIRTYDEQLFTVNMRTGEEKMICDSQLLSMNYLIYVYGSEIIILGNDDIYRLEPNEHQFNKIADMDGYHRFLYGTDCRENMIYFVIEYDEGVGQGIAALNMETKSVSLYQNFDGWKNRNIHVSDIRMGENGFYYINAANSRFAGGGLYYYNMQDKSFSRIMN